MRAWFFALVLIASVFSGESVVAQGRSIPEHPLFLFPTRPEVSIKLVKASNGKPVRGKLISLTALEAIIDTGSLSRRDRERGELGQRISLDRMESLRSTDGRFEFHPKEESDFKVVARRIVAAYSSVKIQGEVDPGKPGLDIASPLPGLPGAAALPGSVTGMAKPGSKEMAEATKPKPNGMGNGGFGGIKNLSKQKKSDSESSSSADADMEEEIETTAEAPGSPAATALSGVTETLFCSNCTKEIPTGAVKSGVCPHCKIAFANVSTTPSSTGKSPFEKSGGAANAGGGTFAPTGTAPSTVPLSGDANNTGTVVVQGGDFSFDSIPGWAKGGLFILLVLVGYQMLFNR